MFKRLRLMLVSAVAIVLTTVLAVAPSSAVVQSVLVDNVTIECGEDGFLLAQVTVILDIQSINPLDLNVYVYPFNEPTGQFIGEVDVVIEPPVPGTYVIPVPLNNRPGGPEANTPEPSGFSAGAVLSEDEGGGFINILGTDFNNQLSYTPPDCAVVPPAPPTDPVDPPVDPAPAPVPEVTISLCAKQYPVLGSVLIAVDNPQVAEWGPGTGTIFIAQNVPLVLPNDANNDGVDEYLIIDTAEAADGETWFGLFIGACDPVYVRASAVPAVIR